MSRRAAVMLGLVLAVALVGLWWWWRGRALRPATAATSSTMTASPVTGRPAGAMGAPAPAAAPLAASPSRAGHLHRIADASARDRLIAAIQAARTRRERAAASAPVAPAVVGAPAAPAEITPDAMLASLMEAVPLLQECYREAQPRLSRAGGKVTVAMTLSGEPDIGTVIDDATLSSEDGLVQDAELARCLHETLMSIELAPMREGGSQAFSIAVELAPDAPVDGGARP